MKGFHFSHQVEAVFGDLDGMGHVNNVVYLKWLETARIDYWIHVTGQKTHLGLPQEGGASHDPGPGVMSGALIDMILARTEIDYRSPVSYGEKLDVFIRTSVIKRSSVVFEYAVRARTDDRLVAEARTVVVCYDYQFMRSKPVPAETRTSILTLDPEARVEI
ncbi:MAG: acyl-CoA thioesterase [Vicinamibacteria bacterium]|nr:acyl-CoA thioesterase [Vicinamibacteria bacterium]